jgi:hypothetical protein
VAPIEPGLRSETAEDQRLGLPDMRPEADGIVLIGRRGALASRR